MTCWRDKGKSAARTHAREFFNLGPERDAEDVREGSVQIFGEIRKLEPSQRRTHGSVAHFLDRIRTAIAGEPEPSRFLAIFGNGDAPLK